jgi:hypothetical protein
VRQLTESAIRPLLADVQLTHVLSDANVEYNVALPNMMTKAEETIFPSFAEIIQFVTSIHTHV